MYNIKTDTIEKGLDILSKITPRIPNEVYVNYSIKHNGYIFCLSSGLSTKGWNQIEKLLGNIDDIQISTIRYPETIEIAKYMWNGVKYCLNEVYERQELKPGHTYKILTQMGDTRYIRYIRSGINQNNHIRMLIEMVYINTSCNFSGTYFRPDKHWYNPDKILSNKYEEIPREEYTSIINRYTDLYKREDERRDRIYDLLDSGKDFIIVD